MGITTDAVKLEIDVQGQREIDALAQSAGQLKVDLTTVVPAADRAAGAVDQVAKSGANSAQSMMQLGRVVQDFQGGGLLGITNNIEGMAMALGLGGGVAGVATLAAVALAALGPQLKQLGEAMFAGDEAARAQAAAVKALAAEQEKLKGQLAELKGAHDGRAAALKAENAALERSIELEKQRAENAAKAAKEETERQKQAVAMEGAPSLEAQRRRPSERARAGDLRRIIGGDPEAATIGRAIDLAMANAHDPRRAKIFGDQLKGDFYAGDASALARVIDMLPEGTLREQLEGLTPAAEAARKKRAIGDTLEGFGRRVRDKAAKGGEELGRRRMEEEAEANIGRVDEENREHAQAQQRARQAAARKKADGARDAREAKAAGKAGHRAGLETQADELLAHGPAIVGQAFGQEGAALAATASPDQVRAMRDRTIQALEQGASPQQAILQAFEAVASAALRQQQQMEHMARMLDGQVTQFRNKMSAGSESPATFIQP